MTREVEIKATPLAILQYIVFGSAILYFGRDIFIPLSFAALISFVIYPSCRWLERKGLSRMMAILINMIFLTALLSGLVALLVNQTLSFLDEWPTVQVKLGETMEDFSLYLNEAYGVSKAEQNKLVTQLFNGSTGGALAFFGKMISASAFSTVLMILIPVYSVLILFYRELWLKVLLRLFPGERRENIVEILSLTINAYYNFIKGMGVVYLVVGILNSIGLLLLGVPHAILFGLIASLLTFIPYVGIMIGALLPMAMAWITYDSVWYPIGIVGVFAFVQYLEANVIFPLAVSSRLNVNTLVMLLSIFIGGLLWGMAGMILFVPFAGILKLIADHTPRLKTLALMLGASEPPLKS
ncbi:MAG TPA: AI-2E family transporter [Chryseosolibacter sp.]